MAICVAGLKETLFNQQVLSTSSPLLKKKEIIQQAFRTLCPARITLFKKTSFSSRGKDSY